MALESINAVITTTQTQHMQHDDMLSGTLIAFALIAVIVFYIVAVFFSLSLYRLGKKIDKEKQIFSAWFAWLFLIPGAGYVFQWLVMPFGIGRALMRYEDKEIQAAGKTLFGLGLAYVLIPLIAFIPLVNLFSMIANIVLFILYWVKASKTSKQLDKLKTQANPAP